MTPRQSYEEKAAAEFARVQAQLEALAAGRREAEVLLVAAQSKHDEALHLFELLKRARDDRWDAAKAHFEAVWAEFRKSLAPRR